MGQNRFPGSSAQSASSPFQNNRVAQPALSSGSAVYSGAPNIQRLLASALGERMQGMQGGGGNPDMPFKPSPGMRPPMGGGGMMGGIQDFNMGQFGEQGNRMMRAGMGAAGGLLGMGGKGRGIMPSGGQQPYNPRAGLPPPNIRRPQPQEAAPPPPSYGGGDGGNNTY